LQVVAARLLHLLVIDVGDLDARIYPGDGGGKQQEGAMVSSVASVVPIYQGNPAHRNFLVGRPRTKTSEGETHVIQKNPKKECSNRDEEKEGMVVEKGRRSVDRKLLDEVETPPVGILQANTIRYKDGRSEDNEGIGFCHLVSGGYE